MTAVHRRSNAARFTLFLVVYIQDAIKLIIGITVHRGRNAARGLFCSL
jgi:hypothetical protein